MMNTLNTAAANKKTLLAEHKELQKTIRTIQKDINQAHITIRKGLTAVGKNLKSTELGTPGHLPTLVKLTKKLARDYDQITKLEVKCNSLKKSIDNL